MRLLTDAPALAQAVAALTSIVPQKSLFPILGTLRLTVEKKRLTLMATNMDCLAAIRVPIKRGEAGDTAIEAARLNAFLDGLKGDVKIEADAQGATATAGRRTAKLAVLPPEEFPDLPFEGDNPQEYELDGPTLASIADIGFAAATSDTRPFLCGVHLFAPSGTLTAEAGDGKVFIQIRFDIETPPHSVIVPRDVLPILKRLFPDGCQIAVTDSKLEASDKTTRFVSKVLHGPYPPTDKFISAAAEGSGNCLITCDADELSAVAARLVAIAGGDNSWVTLFPHADHLLLKSTDKADAEDVVAAECSGSIEQLTVSTKILCPMLSGLGATSVRLSQAKTGAPIRIDPVASDDRLGIVMPVYFRAEKSEREAA